LVDDVHDRSGTARRSSETLRLCAVLQVGDGQRDTVEIGLPPRIQTNDVSARSSERPSSTGTAKRAVPGAGLRIPVWQLGSSLYSAQLAAQMGLPFAFASHFAPDMLLQALHLYRTHFQPSERLEKPYAMVCINIVAADSNRDAEFLFTSMQQAFVKLRRGETSQLPPPIESMDSFWSPAEQYGVQQALSMSLVGDKAKVRHGLLSVLRETEADEIMVNGQIFDHEARLHSFDLAMQVREELLS